MASATAALNGTPSPSPSPIPSLSPVPSAEAVSDAEPYDSDAARAEEREVPAPADGGISLPEHVVALQEYCRELGANSSCNAALSVLLSSAEEHLAVSDGLHTLVSCVLRPLCFLRLLCPLRLLPG